MSTDSVLREQLLALLRGSNAHMNFDQAVADFPLDYINTCPPNVPYTPWHLLEHIRIAQWDILEFTCNPQHVSPPWPKGYWPAPDAHADQTQWEKTLNDIRTDLKAFEAIVQDPNTDFFSDLSHAKGYNVLREVLLVADHNAHHLGEFAILRAVMGTWKK